jgi:hypothetical protein
LRRSRCWCQAQRGLRFVGFPVAALRGADFAHHTVNEALQLGRIGMSVLLFDGLNRTMKNPPADGLLNEF